MSGNHQENSFYAKVEKAISDLETAVQNTTTPDIEDITGLEDALDGKADAEHGHVIADVTGLQSALDGKAASSHTHAQSDITGLVAALASLGSRLTAVENLLDAIGIKAAGVYSGTTDANGDVSVAFPTGKFTNAPVLFTTYTFNNDNYGTFYNVKSLTASAATLRVHRNKNTGVVLGGNVDPDEPLASTEVRIVALEF